MTFADNAKQSMKELPEIVKFGKITAYKSTKTSTVFLYTNNN